MRCCYPTTLRLATKSTRKTSNNNPKEGNNAARCEYSIIRLNSNGIGKGTQRIKFLFDEADGSQSQVRIKSIIGFYATIVNNERSWQGATIIRDGKQQNGLKAQGSTAASEPFPETDEWTSLET